MDAAREALLQRLTSHLDELTNLYRQLLALVSKENDLLLAADLEGLQKNNETKELLIRKTVLADGLRVKIAEELCARLGLDARQPRLLEIAGKLASHEAAPLRRRHAELEKLLTGIAQANKRNEEHAASALKILGGAMNEIKETIAGKKTYGGKGQYKVGPETTGNFVRKEA